MLRDLREGVEIGAGEPETRSNRTEVLGVTSRAMGKVEAEDEVISRAAGATKVREGDTVIEGLRLDVADTPIQRISRSDRKTWPIGPVLSAMLRAIWPKTVRRPKDKIKNETFTLFRCV